MKKPYKACKRCGGDGFTMKRVRMGNGSWVRHQQECTHCNGFGILFREPRLDSVETGLGYRKMRGWFA